MISDTFFYWYTWDYQKELGGWMGGVYNTPLVGYYDSLSYDDNLRELHTASEWGITDHFMDYWAPTWTDHEGKPREALLMRASEALQQKGYGIHMGYYQDGEDFDMKDFARNMDPGRDVQLMVQNYVKSPVWPLVNGKPMWLVYGRNGMPKLTADNAGFREFAKGRYKSIGELNARWGTDYKSFDDVTLDFSAGHQRAVSILYQYQLWKQSWDQVDAIAKAKYGLPGLLPSFDVAYEPYLGYSYDLMPQTWAGPHSYGGIFGPPHESDVQRFIQAQVAKTYNTVFFDTFKNYYHDWEIRVPGTCYPSAFWAFDRFWVQALMHYSEALLHLSWNEWWEGSNLEPSMEYGKTYCQKNLMYSSIMQLCFDSIHNWNSGAKTAVLLNDWHWLAGGRHAEDIYDCIQALRRNNIRFDLLSDDFVSAEKLAQFDVVIAPAGGVGFGYNAKGQAIEAVLRSWIQDNAGKKLILSGDKAQWAWLGLREEGVVAGAAVAPGPDMNVYVDVGTPEDQAFLVEGFSGAEDWGKIPTGNFGATSGKHTVRWTPGVGKRTVFMLPASPGRDHILRIAGSGFQANGITVLVDGQKAGHLDIQTGANTLELKIPAALIGGRQMIELALVYDKAIVPHDVDPKAYPNETRVCNLAIDELQFSTDNIGRSTKQNFKKPEEGIHLAAGIGSLAAGKDLALGFSPHSRLAAAGTVLSTYKSDGAPRDIALKIGQSDVLYANGLLGGGPPEYLDAIVTGWAGAKPVNPIRGEGVIGTTLTAGDTSIVLAYNYNVKRDATVTAAIDTAGRAVSEVQALSKDGQTWQPVTSHVADGKLVIDDTLHYYGVYQVAFAPVQVQSPPLIFEPGETQRVPVILKSAPGHAVKGSLGIKTFAPSFIAEPAPFEVNGEGTVNLRLTATKDCDWGDKTLILDLEIDGHHTYLFRDLLVRRNADVIPVRTVVDAQSPTVTLVNAPNEFVDNGPAGGVSVQVGGQEAKTDDMPSGTQQQATLKPDFGRADKPMLKATEAKLSYYTPGGPVDHKLSLDVAMYPDRYPRAPDAIAPVILFNPLNTYLENYVADIALEPIYPATNDYPRNLYIREAHGNVVPSQVVGSHILTLAMLPPKGACLLYVCRGAGNAIGTDLVSQQKGDGPLTVRNSRLSVTLDPAAGGTMTSLISSQTGLDYGAKSGGISYGSWGRFDVEKPAIGTAAYVEQEDKTHQYETPGTVQILQSGPMVTTAEAQWTDGTVSAKQTYTFFAYQPYFLVRSEAATARILGADELVAFDFRLKRNRLTKIFPNFIGVGETFAKDSICGGFREAPYAPPYATMMTPDAFQESISVIPTELGSIQRFRQGFWPEQRPKPGPIDYAQLEYVSLSRGNAGFYGYVLLHSGYQTTAKAFRDARVDNPPSVIYPKSTKWANWEAPEGATKVAGRWWNPFWHYRATVTVGPAPADAADAAVTVKPDALGLPAGAKLDTESPRALAIAADGSEAGQTPVFWDATQGALLLVAPGTMKRGETRRFALYFDTVENGPKAPSPYTQPTLADRLMDTSLEQGAQYWSLPPGGSVTEQPHSGARCAKLELKTDSGICLLSSNTMAFRPNSAYRLKFWARTTTPGAFVQSNLYYDATYDFPQLGTTLNADGNWHEYTVDLTTRAFPPTVNPSLRLWLINKASVVYLDDITLEPLSETTTPVVVPVKVEAG
jgi:hypothetical protein